jgi:hypothetical protein
MNGEQNCRKQKLKQSDIGPHNGPFSLAKSLQPRYNSKPYYPPILDKY